VTDKERVLQHFRQILMDASRSLQDAEERMRYLQSYIRLRESELAKVQEHDDPEIISRVLQWLQLGEGQR
jgi:hypothetical protein